MGKVFVIGLDGVGFDALTPYLETGKLPCLGRLLEKGVSGPLRSTIPPLTGPAWASFQTGVNPGEHGVFEFTKRNQGSYALSVVNAEDIHCPTIWELLSEAGRRVISIGVPLTYPPRSVDGIIIPGFLTPKRASSCTYPPDAYEELKRVSPNYQFAPHSMHRWTIKSKVKELVEAARARAIAASHFLQQYDWDLFVVHFLATDMAQHDLWGVTQNGDEPLLEVFQGIDHLVGELSETAQHMGATVIVLSDHGMGALEWTFSINTWLLHRGYLTLRRSLLTRLRHLLFRVGLTQNALKRVGLILYPIVYRLGLGRTLFDFMENRGIGRLFSFLFLSLADVDWRNTYAYSYADIGHICLNLQGREPRGLVPERDRELLIEKLIGALEETVNPRTGEPLLGEVFRREEVYHGEHLSRAPDILFMPKDLRTVASGTWRFYSNRALDRPVMRGHHRMEGMVMAIGEPFKHAYHMKGAALVDLAPNILYLLDCPIPRYMDGKLWEDAFLPGTLTERLARWSDRPSTRDEVPRSVSKRDDEELKRRLKALGYLG